MRIAEGARSHARQCVTLVQVDRARNRDAVGSPSPGAVPNPSQIALRKAQFHSQSYLRNARAPRFRGSLKECGRALLGVIACAALIVTGTVWFWTRSDSRTEEIEFAPRTTIHVSTLDATALDEEEPPPPRFTIERVDARVSPGTLVPSSAGTSFGTITVRARLAPGGASALWTLDIDDVSLLARDSHAGRTSIAVTGTAIEVERRSPAVHRLRGRTSRAASRTQQIVLDAERSHVIVDLDFLAAVSVEGRVVDAAGLAAAASDVWLTPVLDATRAAEPVLDLHAETDAGGYFRYSDVLPGRFDLAVGERRFPLTRVEGLVAAQPVTTIETIRLPELHALRLRVVDARDLPVTDARLWSRGSRGGAFDVATDAYGEATAEGLPAGRWRVFARSMARGRANVSVELPLSNPNESLELRLRAP